VADGEEGWGRGRGLKEGGGLREEVGAEGGGRAEGGITIKDDRKVEERLYFLFVVEAVAVLCKL
jgi:hypothetical protein